MSENERRAAFEAWAKSGGYIIFPTHPDTGHYKNPWLQNAWKAWQSAAELYEERGRAAGMAEAAQIARDHDDRIGMTIAGKIEDAARKEKP